MEYHLRVGERDLELERVIERERKREREVSESLDWNLL